MGIETTDHLPGMRTLLKPAFFTSLKVEATTGGLFQEPSFGVASRVFPRFQPGWSAATKSDAEMALNVPVQVAAPEEVVVCVADELVVIVVVVFSVVDEAELVVVVVTELLEVVVALVVAVPGTHW
jgi:hypothetical protein